MFLTVAASHHIYCRRFACSRTLHLTGGEVCKYRQDCFGRLVLGCINTDFCKQILIFQHFSRVEIYKVYAPLHRSESRNSNNASSNMLVIFAQIFTQSCFVFFVPQFIAFCADFDAIWARRNYSKNVAYCGNTSVRIYADICDNLTFGQDR